MKKRLIKKLEKIDNIKLYRDYNFLNDNTLHINTIISLLIIPYDIYSLKKIIILLKKEEVSYIVIGNGSKILFKDKYVSKVVIMLKYNFNYLSFDGENIYACSGANISQLIKYSHSFKLGGLEKLIGIPATIGGAIYNNASAHNVCISDFIHKIDYIDSEGNFKTIFREDAEFSYRNSIFRGNKKLIIIGALFKLEKIDINYAKLVLKETIDYRLKNQPIQFYNCGSLFKNPQNNKAYKLINTLPNEFKIYNDAFISPIHQNFLINKGNANANDIITLINILKNEVKKHYKIDLELELEII